MNKLTFLLILLLICFSTLSAERILVTKFASGASYWNDSIVSHLASFGYTVDVVNITAGGMLSTALQANTYSQVYLYDHVSSLYLNSTDTTALANFFNSHRSLVIDTRSYAYYVSPTSTNEKALLGNVASAFSAYGGGVWVGVDHATTWNQNGNAFLSAINVAQTTGCYSGAIDTYKTGSILLTGVAATSLWTGSLSAAPTGLQSNGLTLEAHAGYGSLTYISAAFTPVPEAATWLALSLGLILIQLRRKMLK